MNDTSALDPVEPTPFVGKLRTTGRMSPVEAVEQALPLVGNATAEELAAFVKDRYGVTLQVRFVPIIREMLKDKERRAASLRARPSFEPGSDAAAEAS